MNSKTCPFLAAMIFAFTWQIHAEDLKLAQWQLSYAGKPLANQTVLLEGKKAPTWFDFFRSREKVKTIAITDDKGFFQTVDLPAGDYTLKLVHVGKEPVAVKMFTLAKGYKDVSEKVELKDSVKFEEQLKTDVLRQEETQPK